ncbi:hypothetical protein AGMMS50256_23890 [Betaproteobacteria bacterium]|nr:hypothetical protein AGMMS50256_23890 [Betaproteobacteria bacterium]
MEMKYQRGVSLSGLIAWGIVIGLVAVLGMKVGPEVIDYYKIKKCVASTAANSGGGKTVQDIRGIYARYADVDHIKTIDASDLDISKEGNEIVISFAYETRVHLFYNINLLIEFEGSSRQQ